MLPVYISMLPIYRMPCQASVISDINFVHMYDECICLDLTHYKIFYYIFIVAIQVESQLLSQNKLFYNLTFKYEHIQGNNMKQYSNAND